MVVDGDRIIRGWVLGKGENMRVVLMMKVGIWFLLVDLRREKGRWKGNIVRSRREEDIRSLMRGMLAE